jgi:hypothetical protein
MTASPKEKKKEGVTVVRQLVTSGGFEEVVAKSLGRRTEFSMTAF